MSYRWVWWPATKNRKTRITREQVVLSEDKKVGFIHRTDARKADVFPCTRLFKTKEEAEQAVVAGGKLGWSYKLETWRGEVPTGGAVVRVRGAEGYNGNFYVQPVDAKGIPTKGESFHGPLFDSEKEAQNTLAEKLRMALDEFERDMREAHAKVKFLRAACMRLEREGVTIPTTAQLRKRQAARRKRRIRGLQ